MPPTPPIPVIAVVGSRKSGKTTTVEAVVKQLTKKGYKTATAKHIHEPNFTIDAKGKDTWRHAKAGAQMTIGVSQKELAIIKKTDTAKYTLNDIRQNCQDNTDVIILEGFRKLIAQDPTVPKIVTAKNRAEINEANQAIKPILAFTGPAAETETTTNKIPYVNVKKTPSKLADIIDKRIGPIIQKRRETKDAVNISINGKTIPLNTYVQNVARNVTLAIISTLKGVTVKGNENVHITITNPSKTD